MIFKAKNLTNLTVATLMLGLVAWAIVHATMKPEARHIVGVVEVTEVK